MPSKYKSNREKITEIIDTIILPSLKRNDLDWNKVIQMISIEAGVSANIAETTLKSLVELGKIKEVHVITIPDNQILDFLKDIKEQEQTKEETEKILKESSL